MNEFKSSFNAPTGLIESSWKKENGKIIYQVTIPPNSTATLRLSIKKGQHIRQNQKSILVSKDYAYKVPLVSGKYIFEIE